MYSRFLSSLHSKFGLVGGKKFGKGLICWPCILIPYSRQPTTVNNIFTINKWRQAKIFVVLSKAPGLWEQGNTLHNFGFSSVGTIIMEEIWLNDKDVTLANWVKKVRFFANVLVSLADKISLSKNNNTVRVVCAYYSFLVFFEKLFQEHARACATYSGSTKRQRHLGRPLAYPWSLNAKLFQKHDKPKFKRQDTFATQLITSQTKLNAKGFFFFSGFTLYDEPRGKVCRPRLCLS